MGENVQHVGIYLDLLDTGKTNCDKSENFEQNQRFAIANLKVATLLGKKIILSQTQLLDSTVINNFYSEKQEKFKECIVKGFIGVSLYDTPSLKDALIQNLENNIDHVNRKGGQAELSKLFKFSSLKEFQEGTVKEVLDCRKSALEVLKGHSNIEIACNCSDKIKNYLYNIEEISRKIQENGHVRFHPAQTPQYALGDYIRRLKNVFSKEDNEDVRKCLIYLYDEAKKVNAINSRSFYYGCLEEYFKKYIDDCNRIKIRKQVCEIIDTYYNLVVGSSIKGANIELNLPENIIEPQLSNLISKDILAKKGKICTTEHGNYTIDNDKKLENITWSDIFDCCDTIKDKEDRNKAFMEYYKGEFKNKFNLTSTGIVMCSSSIIMPNVLSATMNHNQENLLLASAFIVSGLSQIFFSEYCSRGNKEIRNKRKIFRTISKQLNE